MHVWLPVEIQSEGDPHWRKATLRVRPSDLKEPFRALLAFTITQHLDAAEWDRIDRAFGLPARRGIVTADKQLDRTSDPASNLSRAERVLRPAWLVIFLSLALIIESLALLLF